MRKFVLLIMTDLKVLEFNPHKPRYSERLTEEEWEKFKPILINLDQQGLTRREVMKVAARYHGFRGTYAALITRFKKWGLTTTRDVDLVSPIQGGDGDMTSPAFSDEENTQIHYRPDAQQADRAVSLCEQPGEFGTAEVLVNVIPQTVQTPQEPPEPIPDDLDQLIRIAQAVTLEPIELNALDMMSESQPKIEQPSSMLAGTGLVLASIVQPAATLDNPNLPGSNRFSKRTRPSSSSIRSSISNASSDIRQFLHLAKRLRHAPGTPSTQHFSLASSHESQNFAMVTGLGLELDTVVETPAEPEEAASIRPLNFLLRRRKPKWRPESQTSNNRSTSPGNTLTDTIPDHEFTHWQDLNLDDFKLINTALQAQTKSTSHRRRLAHVTQLPLVTIPEASVLAKKYPAARAVLLSSWHDDLTVYYLLDGSVTVIERGRLPLLSDAVGEASRRFERWRRFDKNPVKIEL